MKKKFVLGLLTLALIGGVTLSVNAQEKKKN